MLAGIPETLGMPAILRQIAALCPRHSRPKLPERPHSPLPATTRAKTLFTGGVYRHSHRNLLLPSFRGWGNVRSVSRPFVISLKRTTVSGENFHSRFTWAKSVSLKWSNRFDLGERFENIISEVHSGRCAGKIESVGVVFLRKWDLLFVVLIGRIRRDWKEVMSTKSRGYV